MSSSQNTRNPLRIQVLNNYFFCDCILVVEVGYKARWSVLQWWHPCFYKCSICFMNSNVEGIEMLKELCTFICFLMKCRLLLCWPKIILLDQQSSLFGLA